MQRNAKLLGCLLKIKDHRKLEEMIRKADFILKHIKLQSARKNNKIPTVITQEMEKKKRKRKRENKVNYTTKKGKLGDIPNKKETQLNLIY